jgi:uncharacterized phage protein (TIGR01671 family)
MREIKFRWWDKTKNAMCYGVEQYIVGCLIDYEPLMQYTGLKDKNGREIYEGDIVSYQTGYSEPYITEVSWTDIDNEGWNMGGFIVYPPWVDHGEVEVVGNIYENPELLTKD